MDSRSRRDGAAIEELGWFNPIDLDHSFSLKEDRILYWLKKELRLPMQRTNF